MLEYLLSRSPDGSALGGRQSCIDSLRRAPTSPFRDCDGALATDCVGTAECCIFLAFRFF